MHRTAYLARATGERILFTTYIATLPRVLESLLARLAPDMVGRIDFVGEHKFAKDLLNERGIPFRTPGQEASLAFDNAWNAIRGSSPLRSARFGRRYWEDEVKHVIKGRGLTRFDEYADLARIGRRHAIPLETRQAVWDLHKTYTSGLRKRRALDWEDVVLLARQSLRDRPLER